MDKNNRTVMAIGAHADDIELNVGGTLLKYRDAGYKIVYVMSTNNFSGGWSKLKPDGTVESSKPPYHVIEPQRKKEVAAAAEVLGATVVHLDHPQRHYTRDDGTVAEVRYGSELPKGLPADIPTILTACEHKPSIAKLADLIVEHSPEVIITHGCAAGNPEHFATALLVANAYDEAVKRGYQGLLLQWRELCITAHGRLNEIWNTFVDITGYEKKRLDLIGLHACQIPIPARLDLPKMGAACGCGEAEAFILIKGNLQPWPHQTLALEIMGNLRDLKG